MTLRPLRCKCTWIKLVVNEVRKFLTLNKSLCFIVQNRSPIPIPSPLLYNTFPFSIWTWDTPQLLFPPFQQTLPVQQKEIYQISRHLSVFSFSQKFFPPRTFPSHIPTQKCILLHCFSVFSHEMVPFNSTTHCQHQNQKHYCVFKSQCKQAAHQMIALFFTNKEKVTIAQQWHCQQFSPLPCKHVEHVRPCHHKLFWIWSKIYVASIPIYQVVFLKPKP